MVPWWLRPTSPPLLQLELVHMLFPVVYELAMVPRSLVPTSPPL